MRQVIHDFNENGFGTLDPKWRGAGPRRPIARRVNGSVRSAVCYPVTWDGRPRRGACRSCGTCCVSTVLPISAARLCGRSYDNPPNDGHVVCVDEFGPLNLHPRAGRGWQPRRRPQRLRATYHRTQGVRHVFSALDLSTGQIYCRIPDRKRWTEFRAFLRSLQSRWPGEKPYVIVELLSAQTCRSPRLVRGQRRETGVPADYSSWLNYPISCPASPDYAEENRQTGCPAGSSMTRTASCGWVSARVAPASSALACAASRSSTGRSR